MMHFKGNVVNVGELKCSQQFLGHWVHKCESLLFVYKGFAYHEKRNGLEGSQRWVENGKRKGERIKSSVITI